MADIPRSPPVSDAEREQLEAALDALPPPLEPLDISALDGYLVGVLLQPRAPPPDAWLRWALDVEGRPAPRSAALDAALALIRRRHAELDRAIAARQWFDPWVFELDAHGGDPHGLPAEVVLPWVAGFAAALEHFGALLALDDPGLREPLATLYAYFDADDLEDVDDLRELIDQTPPPDSVAEAVEDLVRCTLLLADVSRPRRALASVRAPKRNPRRP